MQNREVQKIAKDTMSYIRQTIKPGMNLREVRRICEERMVALGADSFWYWDVGAFVFSGDETAVSLSGKDYVTQEREICENDLITIDLSPQVGNVWGDYARTIVLENGRVVEENEIKNSEWKQGILLEDELHAELIRYGKPETTFEDLYCHMNARIAESGFINLDFIGNLGHSIAKRKEDRIYIEKGNRTQIEAVDYFTFEPHIGVKGSKFGYKKENIYYFENGVLKEL